MDTIYSALIPTATSGVRSEIAQTLARFGAPILSLVAASGTVIQPLQPHERYADASPVLSRLCATLDSWPVPPAGLFVVEERRVYLRSLSPMTIAHEFGHALDCALGGGVYLSGISRGIRKAFQDTRAFVTPYAASAVDEYFAESVRAYVGVNDPESVWPSVSRTKLEQIDGAIYAIIDAIFRGAS